MKEILYFINIFVIGFAFGWVAYPLWSSLRKLWNSPTENNKDDDKNI